MLAHWSWRGIAGVTSTLIRNQISRYAFRKIRFHKHEISFYNFTLTFTVIVHLTSSFCTFLSVFTSHFFGRLPFSTDHYITSFLIVISHNLILLPSWKCIHDQRVI